MSPQSLSNLDPFDEFPEIESAPGKDPIEAFVLPLLRARVLIILCAIFGAVVGTVFALSKPNLYTSVGKILVRVGMRESRVAESVFEEDPGTWASRSAVTDEIHILRSPEVYRRVATEVGADRVLATYDPTRDDGPGTSQITASLHKAQKWWFSRSAPGPIDPKSEVAIEAASMTVQAGLNIVPLPKSSVLSISYEGHTPRVCQDVVDVFLKMAQERHREQYSKPLTASSELASEKAKASGEKVQSLQEELAAYEKEHGISNMEEQIKALIASIDETRKEVERQSLEIQRLDVLIEKDVELLADETPERIVVTDPEQRLNPQWERLSRETSHLEVELEKAKREARENDLPETRLKRDRLQREFDQKARQLKGIEKFSEQPKEKKIEKNEHYYELDKRIKDNRSARAALIETKARSETIAASRRSELDALNTAKPRHAELMRELDAAKRTFDTLKNAVERNAIFRELDASNEMSNLIIIQDANFPLTKSGPKRTVMVGAGGAGGFMFGVALAFLFAFLDRKFRRPQEIERILGVKVIGVVPECRGLRKRLN